MEGPDGSKKLGKIYFHTSTYEEVQVFQEECDTSRLFSPFPMKFRWGYAENDF